MNQRNLQTIYESNEDRQLARILSNLIWVAWGQYLIVILSSLFYNSDWKLITAAMAGSALLIAAMLLLWRGKLRASSLLMVLSTLGTVTVIATIGQGIRDLAMLAIPIIFIFAGLTLNRVLFRLCVGLALAAVCWLVFGEIFGWFVTIPFAGEMATWLYLISTITILLVAALAVELLTSNMRNSLDQARQEIAQRMRAEEREALSLAEVKNNEKRFHALIEHGRDNISLVAADGTLLWENPTVNSILGYMPNQFVGHNIFELMHPNDQALIRDLYAQVVQSAGSIQEGEFRLLHADGTWRWIESSAKNLLDKPGVQAIVLNYRDITKRKQLEESLKQSEAKYRKIVETTNEGVIVLDRDTRTTLINQQMAAMLGYTIPEILGQKLEALLFEADLGDHQAQMTLRAQGQSSIYERCFRRKDGSRLWTLISATATTDTEGNFDGAFDMITDITERKHTEEALYESEARFRSMFETHDAIMLLIEPYTGLILEANQAATNFYGYAKSTLCAMRIEDINTLPPAQVVAERQKALCEERNYFIFPHRLANGEERLVEVHSSPIAIQDKQVLFSVIHDITERKRAEDALRENAIRYRTLLDNLPQFVWQRDLDSVFVDGNAACAQMLGTTVKELAGKTDYDFYPVNLAEKYRADDQHIIENGASETFEERFLVDGNEHFARTTKVPLRDDTDRIYGTLGIAEDITERKRSHEALMESEARFREVLENSLDASYKRNLKTNRYEYLSPVFKRISGYTPEEFENLPLETVVNLMHPDDHAISEIEVANSLSLGKGMSNKWNYRLKHKDGRYRWIQDQCILVRDEQGQPAALIGSVSDITERKQTEAKIRATLEEKETLLREVHHRVKNNLQVIIALIKMRARSAQDSGTLQFLTELEGQAHTMALVYEQLYQSENLAQVSMSQYLRQLTANVLDTYGRRDGIQFHLDAALALDVAQATPCGLIVNELFSNIIKYAFPPGFTETPIVSITLRQEDGTYHLTVSDNGVGFPSGYDWRVGQSMGLRLVNLWVTHQLGGTLAVSEKPGTTFEIAFDLKD